MSIYSETIEKENAVRINTEERKEEGRVKDKKKKKKLTKTFSFFCFLAGGGGKGKPSSPTLGALGLYFLFSLPVGVELLRLPLPGLLNSPIPPFELEAIEEFFPPFFPLGVGNSTGTYC